jgi:hypothetical protein
MDFNEIVRHIESSHPGLIGMKVPRTVAIAMLRAAFLAIREELNGIEEGPLAVAGLGTFVVRNIEQTQGNERVTRRVVGFRYRQDDRLPG